MKKVPLTPKPQAGKRPPTVDDWVNAPSVPDEEPPPAPPEVVPMKRLTIDVPEELHTRIKASCALRGAKMADEIRRLLESHFDSVK